MKNMISIRMSLAILKLIDQVCMEQGISKSLFFRKIFKLGYMEWKSRGKPNIFEEIKGDRLVKT